MPRAATYTTALLKAVASCVIPVRDTATDMRDGFAQWQFEVTVDVDTLVRGLAYAAANSKGKVLRRAGGAVVVRAVRVTHRMPEGGEWQEVPDGK